MANASRGKARQGQGGRQMQGEARQGGRGKGEARERQRSCSLLGQTLNHKANLVSQRKRVFYEQYICDNLVGNWKLDPCLDEAQLKGGLI